jgi:hypothetical protein
MAPPTVAHVATADGATNRTLNAEIVEQPRVHKTSGV